MDTKTYRLRKETIITNDCKLSEGCIVETTADPNELFEAAFDEVQEDVRHKPVKTPPNKPTTYYSPIQKRLCRANAAL